MNFGSKEIKPIEHLSEESEDSEKGVKERRDSFLAQYYYCDFFLTYPFYIPIPKLCYRSKHLCLVNFDTFMIFRLNNFFNKLRLFQTQINHYIKSNMLVLFTLYVE